MTPYRKPPRDVEIWVPVVPASGRISIEHHTPDGVYCILLTPDNARALGTRLIGAAAVLKERRRREKVRE